jgi:5'-deoxynucleotidase YfbR-like HD superfamily hydrolase
VTGPPLPPGRLADQLRFLLEVDALKRVERRTRLTDGSRLENSAEHSWHAALFALVLAEHAPDGVDLARVIAMLLVHDVVEVDAGDVSVYDEAGQAGRAERERLAARRLFGLLPPDQEAALRALWEEFEARETPDSRFANAMDRLSPVLLGHAGQGRSWLAEGIAAAQVRARNAGVGEVSPALGEVVYAVVLDSVARGWLAPDCEP